MQPDEASWRWTSLESKQRDTAQLKTSRNLPRLNIDESIVDNVAGTKKDRGNGGMRGNAAS